jgi:hypothetical protein
MTQSGVRTRTDSVVGKSDEKKDSASSRTRAERRRTEEIKKNNRT